MFEHFLGRKLRCGTAFLRHIPLGICGGPEKDRVVGDVGALLIFPLSFLAGSWCALGIIRSTQCLTLYLLFC